MALSMWYLSYRELPGEKRKILTFKRWKGREGKGREGKGRELPMFLLLLCVLG